MRKRVVKKQFYVDGEINDRLRKIGKARGEYQREILHRALMRELEIMEGQLK